MITLLQDKKGQQSLSNINKFMNTIEYYELVCITIRLLFELEKASCFHYQLIILKQVSKKQEFNNLEKHPHTTITYHAF